MKYARKVNLFLKSSFTMNQKKKKNYLNKMTKKHPPRSLV